MIHRAIIERAIDVGSDGFGNPLPPEYDIQGNYPILAWASTIKSVIDGDKLAVLPIVAIRAEKGADIIESDRIQSITGRTGLELFPGPLTILTAQPNSGGFLAIIAQEVKAA
jgi:hypothetical protein